MSASACMSLLLREVISRSTATRRVRFASLSSSKPTQTVRSFFASSTDHTRLLQESRVFRLPQSDNGDNNNSNKETDHVMYVLAASGSELALVQKVPHLHLARLHRSTTKENADDNGGGGGDNVIQLWGAKVVNRTLGLPVHVCGKLVDAALEDALVGSNGNDNNSKTYTNSVVTAKTTLHGMCDWVSKLSDEQLRDIVAGSDNDCNIAALREIAHCKNNNQVYAQHQKQWEALAQHYVLNCQDLAHEAALYQSKGAQFKAIFHHADTSEFADTCAGTMALMEFR